jgi:hypothetical protein
LLGSALAWPNQEFLMPINKDFKRLVRRRMQKTGESYTTARQRLSAQPPPRVRARTARAHGKPAAKTAARTAARAVANTALAVVATESMARAVRPADYARLAGMSDAAVKAKTGCGWEKWVKALDYHGAQAMSHREIATLVRDAYKTPSWWTQMVAVGYERIRGLRARGQQRDGSYEASKSKTFSVPLAELYRAFADAGVRQRWLADATFTVRSSSANKAMRIVRDDKTVVLVGFASKGASKSQVAVQHMKLSSVDAAADIKAFWAGRFDVLAKMLSARA